MKSRNAVKRLGIVLTLVFCLGLLGCEGDDGDRGPQGPEGPPGPPAPGVTEQAADIAILDAEITDVTIQSPPVVTFRINGLDGQPLTDLSQEDVDNRSLRFGIAKLIPGEDGNEDDWQSYINTTEVAEESEPRADGIAAGNEAIQATTENGGTLENLGNGEYRYTFATDVANVTDPVAVSFEPDLLHRAAIQIEFEEEIGGEEKLQVANPTFDFVPSGGAAPVTRNMVDTASCNECHDLLAIHGGARVEIEYCVTCHNPGTTDANSGNNLNLKVLVHKIHSGRELPSVQAFEESDGAQGEPYIIWGFNNSEHNYSEVGYPGDVRNCTKCHNEADVDDEGEALTPDAAQWKTRPTIEACMSCHDDVFINADVQGPQEAFQEAHAGGTGLANSSCAGCHPAEGEGFGQSVTDAHIIHEQFAGRSFQFNIVETSFDSVSGDLDVTVSVSDPATGMNYDFLADPEFTAAGGVSRMAVLIGWNPNFDFHNAFAGTEEAQPILINPLLAENVTPNETANGPTFTVTVNIPEGVEAVRVALEGHPAAADEDTGEFTVRVPVQNVFEDVSLVANGTPERREVVSIDKCLVCHNQLSVHGSNRTNNIGVCVICHNPNATDAAVIPAVDDPDTDFNELEFGQTSIDFKRLIHAIHGSGIRENNFTIFGFGGTLHDFGADSVTGEPVLYPGILENCLKCHIDESYNLPLENFVLASSTDVGGDAVSPLDDTNITPAAAVCSSCHDSEAAVAHMTQNGGDFEFVTGAVIAAVDPNTGDDAATEETCVICHGPGRTAPVGEVHFIQEVSVPEPEEPGPVDGETGEVTANAGEDQTIAATGTQVQLDAGGSTGPAGATLTYDWTLTDPDGVAATEMLSATDVANPTFTPDAEGVWTATVEVSDGTTFDTDTVDITVGAAPAGVAADAGDDQTIAATGTQVQLDASGSTGPVGSTLTYNWTLTGPAGDATAMLSATDVVNPTFTPDAEGTWTATVEVGDGTTTDTDSVVITVGGGGGAEPPATIIFENTQGDITFSHTNHVTREEGSCTSCHDTDPPQAIGVDGFAAGHAFCGECHAQPTAGPCNFCHGN